MKICIINNLYPPYMRGGAEQVVVKTVEELIAAGHQVVVITTTPQGEYVERNQALTIYRHHPWNLFFYTHAQEHGIFVRLLWHAVDIFHVGSMRYVERILRVELPDVVHTHNLMGVSFLIPRLIQRLDIHYAHTVHDVQLVEPSGIIRKAEERHWRYTGLPIRLYSALMKRLIGSPNVVISPSQFLLNFYEARGFFPASYRVLLRNPVNSAVRTLDNPSHETVQCLYLGQVEEHKGVVFLVRAFLAFIRAGGKARLHIAGTGSQLPVIEQIIGASTDIVLHGKVERHDLPELFSAVDVTIVPSLCYENSPTVIFESFSFGVPVLASNVEGIAELIVEGENGFTFATGDEPALEAKLAWSAAHHEVLHSMRKKTIEFLVGLSRESYTKRLLQLYSPTFGDN